MLDPLLTEKEAAFEKELADLIQKHTPKINLVGIVKTLKDTMAYLLSLSDSDELITIVINQMTMQAATHRFNRLGEEEAMKEIDDGSDNAE